MWLDKLEGNEFLFDIKTKIKTKIKKVKIINDNLYIYVIDNSIMIYDYKTFKQKAVLNLPFKTNIPYLEILENEVLLYLIGARLYFYKINIKEKKLEFMLYIPNVFNFCYLEKRKEIFFLLKNTLDPARCDLNGNIISFVQKKPKTIYEFSVPKYYNNCIKNFSKMEGINNDKYIIHINGGPYIYMVYYGEGDIAINYNISVYNTEGKILLSEKNTEEFLNYTKIADNLFQAESQERLFYYNEEKNKIEFINNVLDYINNEINEEKNILEGHKFLLWGEFGYVEIMGNSHIISKYFYLTDKMFAIYDNEFHLFLIDISNEKKIIRKIKLNWIGGSQTHSNIKNIYYIYSNGEEQLYISFQEYKNNEYEEYIIHGVIKEKNK